MKPASPVLPGMPDLAAHETKIAEHQPEYGTLPALAVGGGWILTRWEFEDGEREAFARGGTLSLFVMHGEGAAARDHRLASREPEPRAPMLLEPWDGRPHEDPRYAVFPWRPFPEESRDVLATGSVWLFQQTAGQPVQPVALIVGEA